MDNNDIRLAIHAITTQGKRLETGIGGLHDSAADLAKEIDARIDAVVAQITALQPLADFLAEIRRAMTEEMPGILEDIEKNPMAKMILGGGLGPLKGIIAGLQDKVK